MLWTHPLTGEELRIANSTEFYKELGRFNDSNCGHHSQELRWALDASGRKQLRFQCLTCGSLVGPARKQSEATALTKNEDPGLRADYNEKRINHEVALFTKYAVSTRAEENSEYYAYLETPEWRQRRALVLARAKGICEGCGTARAEHVHHLTYRHIFNELLFELVALCRPCHAKAHDKDDQYSAERDG